MSDLVKTALDAHWFTFRHGVSGLAAAAMAVALGGCSCHPTIPDSDDPPQTETATVDTAPPPHTGETGAPAPAGPCTITEVEPNDQLDAGMALPTDEYLCGAFDHPADFDYYTVDLAEAGWLGVYIDAQIRGSLADVETNVTGDAGFAVNRGDDDGSRDAHLVFPAPAGTYHVMLFDRNLLGGDDDFFYELVVSVAKKPVAETATEVEPDDTSDLAQPVAAGDVVLGGADAQNDVDWYRVDVPAGSHKVTLDVTAYSAGSPGNFKIFTYPDGLSGDVVIVPGRPTGGLDPLATLTSPGGETLWFRVEETDGHGGPGWWYALNVSVEAL